MKLKFIGYAVPPLPGIHFAPSVYFDGQKNFFSVANKDYFITEFIPLALEVPIAKMENEQEVWKEVGNPEFYVFYNIEAKNIVGEFLQIKDDLQLLLDSKKLNVFAKISIAIFLKQKKASKELLSQIPNNEGRTDFFDLKEQFKKTIEAL